MNWTVLIGMGFAGAVPLGEIKADFTVRGEPDIEQCEEAEWGELFIDYPETPPRQGAEIALKPRRVDGPFGIENVPLECTSHWRSSDRSLATVNPSGVLSIADEAEPGATVTISTRVGAKETALSLRIVGSNQPSLIGSWNRLWDDDCATDSERQPAIVFIRFSQDDYWAATVEGREFTGSYAFDPETGAVEFTPLALPGNPPTGTANIRGGRLVLGGLEFSDPWGRPMPRGCPLIFTPAPDPSES